MRLLDLEPKFVKYLSGGVIREVSSLAEADGIRFLCPKCFRNFPRNVHQVICWSPSVPGEVRPGPGRWEMSGSNFHDLSLTAKSSSVRVTSGCRAHFFVQNGEIRTA